MGFVHGPQNCWQSMSKKLSWPWRPSRLTIFGTGGFNDPFPRTASQRCRLPKLVEVWQWEDHKNQCVPCLPKAGASFCALCIFLFILYLNTSSHREVGPLQSNHCYTCLIHRKFHFILILASFIPPSWTKCVQFWALTKDSNR